MKKHLSGLAVLAALFGAGSLHAQQFHQLESAVNLSSSAPDWDYLTFEPARSYLYIGARPEGVIVYDVNAKKVVDRIAEAKGANSTTLVPEFDRGYTTNKDGTSTVFQISTLKAVGSIKLGNDADAGFYEPVTKQVVFMRGDSKEMTFVDARSGEVTGRLAMKSKKLEGTAPDGNGSIFTAQRDTNSVVRVHAAAKTVTAEWPTTGCEEPNGLAIDRQRKRLFVGCRGSRPVLVVMDSESGYVVTTLEIGRGNDGVTYDPETGKIYASGGVDGNLVVYSQFGPDTYKLAEATTTRPYARTMALDPKTKKVYMVTAEGTVDPSKKVNRGPAPFYPNRYFPDTLTLLTYSPK